MSVRLVFGIGSGKEGDLLNASGVCLEAILLRRLATNASPLFEAEGCSATDVRQLQLLGLKLLFGRWIDYDVPREFPAGRRRNRVAARARLYPARDGIEGWVCDIG